MSKQPLHLYEFGPFHLNPGERLLLRKNQVVPLTPKVFDTLLVLVENHGHVLEKDDLMKTLWPDSFVEESSLSQNISLLRKALGEGNSERQYIERFPGAATDLSPTCVRLRAKAPTLLSNTAPPRG
ncbi:MAG: transcriptional regulator, partial [Acidobacteriota bacterium]|nr:transcriptional regulator [Acidobacteriota bacterium]